MKRIAFLTTVALSLCALSSCTEDPLGLDVVSGNKGDIIITTEPFSNGESLTRTEVKPDYDSVSVYWATGDKIGIVPDGGRQIYFDVDPTVENTKKAVFDGRAWNLRDFVTYYAYYPYSNANNSDSISVENIHFSPVPQVIRNKWNDTDHLGAADLLVGSGVQPENSALNIQFKHLCALVKFTISLDRIETGSNITQFRIFVSTDTDNENGTFIYDAEVNLKDDNPHLVARTGGTSNSWAISFENIVKESAETTSASFYAILPPAQLNGKTLEAVLSTNKNGRYNTTSYYIDMQQNLVAGKAYDLKMAYGDSDPVVRLDGTQVVWFDGAYGKDSIVMVPIKPHVFDMGIVTGHATDSERAKFDDDNNTPITTTAYVTNDFYIGETEVTQGQWKAVMGELPCAQPVEDDSYPVVGVEYYRAHLFCERLSALTGLRFHLPSSAQWQLAAMASNNADLASYYYPGSYKMEDVVVYKLNAPHGHMALARSGAPNGAALYNMGGNVKEIIYDLAEDAPANRSMVNYFGPASGDAYLTRGAGWKSNYDEASKYSLITCPGERHPLDLKRYDDIGLRVVCSDEIIENVGGKWLFAYGYVDLGLSTGTLWATADLNHDYENMKGRVNLVDYKLKFMKEVDAFSQNKLLENRYYSFYDDVCGDKRSTDNDDYRPSSPSSARCLQGDKKLAIEYQMGDHWQTPSLAQWSELFRSTMITHADNCVILTSKANGKKIYFRLAGYKDDYEDSPEERNESAYYWSSDYDPVTNSITNWLFDTLWTKAKLAAMNDDDEKETDRWGTSYKLKMRAVVNPNTTKIK